MENEFIYWRHPSVPGIKIEEVTGGDRYKGEVWRDMARQVYCENGREAYREIGHFNTGAPFLHGESARISITHCPGLFVVATLPPTPEVELSHYTPRAALGIDAERADRAQVLRLRERFLSELELEMIPADDVAANVLAWTIKEAAYKAALTPGLEFARDIRIKKMPLLGPPTPVFDHADFPGTGGKSELPEEYFGEAVIVAHTDGSQDSSTDGKLHSDGKSFKVYSYMSDDFIVTLCYEPRCAKFGKQP